jgi:hypothetical protein
MLAVSIVRSLVANSEPDLTMKICQVDFFVRMEWLDVALQEISKVALDTLKRIYPELLSRQIVFPAGHIQHCGGISSDPWIR